MFIDEPQFVKAGDGGVAFLFPAKSLFRVADPPGRRHGVGRD
jgi:hypothetical protein